MATLADWTEMDEFKPKFLVLKEGKTRLQFRDMGTASVNKFGNSIVSFKVNVEEDGKMNEIKWDCSSMAILKTLRSEIKKEDFLNGLYEITKTGEGMETRYEIAKIGNVEVKS